MASVARLFLLLLAVTATLAVRQFARSRSQRALNKDYGIPFHPSLRWRFDERSQHQLIPLSHDLLAYRQRHRSPEYHDEKRKGKLAGPDKETFEVCYQDDNGFPCTCTKSDNVWEIDCRNETLRTTNIVPSIKSVKIEVVNMEGNVITELWKERIVPDHVKTLKALILRRNSIFFIEEGAFSGMNELVTLDLSVNRLTHLPRKTWAGGEGLEWKLKNLYLDNNQLTKLDDYVFEDLSMLEKIVLDNNDGLILTNNTFGDLPELKELSLDGCGIKELPQDIFKKLTRLEVLSLRDNPLAKVPAPVKQLASLIALDISATYIDEFTYDALAGDYKLEKLFARDMTYLWLIEFCAFCGLPNLKEVVFYNSSKLYDVDAHAFGNETTRKATPWNITLLDFEKCNISTLSGQMLNWNEVKKLKLGENPYHCDCNLSWMGELTIDTSASDVAPRCATPAHLEGRPVSALRKRELCNGSFRFGRLFVGLTLLLLASVGLIVVWYICTTRGRDGNGLRIRNVFYKPQLPRYGYRNLVVKEDEQALANDDFDDRPVPADYSRKERTLPPPAEV